MDLELNEEGGSRVEIFDHIPTDLRNLVLPLTIPIAIGSSNFKGLLQKYKSRGFDAWHSRYWTKRPVIITSRGSMAVLELRIALSNSIRGTWDKIIQPHLPKHFFNLCFTPHVITKAIFDSADHYETFDIHFELSFLESLGFEYHQLDTFIKEVHKNQPTEITDTPFPCPSAMVDAVNAILRNDYTDIGKAYFLECKVKEILLLALEALCKREKIMPLSIKQTDLRKLESAKEIIEKCLPVYPGNEYICRETGLNEFKLSVGFWYLFNTTPYDYYMLCKMKRGRELLMKKENNVEGTAYLLGYEDSSAFIKEFKKMFDYTPGWFKKHGFH